MNAVLALLHAAWSLAFGLVHAAWRRYAVASPRRTDAALLAMFAGRHYGYPALPEPMQGDAFAIAGSVAIIALIVMLRPWLPLAAWIVGEELLVAGCSAWWLVDPWIVTGGEQCSSRIGFKLGSIGLVALALVVWRLSTITGHKNGRPNENA